MSQSQSPQWANASAPASSTEVEEDNGNIMGDLMAPVSTLDEPVLETIMRDVRSVYSKLRVVLLPLDRTTPFGYAGISQEELQPGTNQLVVINRLRDWDLWGPLLICLWLSVILSIKAPTNQASAVFGAVFVAVWAGSAVVTLNAQMLGGTISFFQSVCVLGYCVFPLAVASVVIFALKYTWFGVVWLDLIWLGIALVWSTRASTIFIGQYIVKERRALAVYPVFFFYIFLSWLILLF